MSHGISVGVNDLVVFYEEAGRRLVALETPVMARLFQSFKTQSGAGCFEPHSFGCVLPQPTEPEVCMDLQATKSN